MEQQSSVDPAGTLVAPFKAIRAEYLTAQYARGGWRGVVCFSSGNAAKELEKLLSVHDVLSITPQEHSRLAPTRFWWHPSDIRRMWPDMLDATPGHLPTWMMIELGRLYRTALQPLDPAREYSINSGSGETVLCLRWTFPRVTFVARYDQRRPETTWHEEAPLNDIVTATGPVVIVTPNGRETMWGKT